jgi:hypothetical protein
VFHADQRSAKEAQCGSVNNRSGEQRTTTSEEVAETAKGQTNFTERKALVSSGTD